MWNYLDIVATKYNYLSQYNLTLSHTIRPTIETGKKWYFIDQNPSINKDFVSLDLNLKEIIEVNRKSSSEFYRETSCTWVDTKINGLQSLAYISYGINN